MLLCHFELESVKIIVVVVVSSIIARLTAFAVAQYVMEALDRDQAAKQRHLHASSAVSVCINVFCSQGPQQQNYVFRTKKSTTSYRSNC